MHLTANTESTCIGQSYYPALGISPFRFRFKRLCHSTSYCIWTSRSYSFPIHKKGAALDNCLGFYIDGTIRPCSRPGENQRLLYNGHNSVNAIRFQSVLCPNNGLIANLFGPVEQKRHASGIWQNRI